MRASGESGLVKVGYQVAYRLGAWSIVLEHQLPRAYNFRAAVVRCHDFWSTQRPMDLVLSIGNAEWTWRGIEPRFEDADTMAFELVTRPEAAQVQQPQQQGAVR